MYKHSDLHSNTSNVKIHHQSHTHTGVKEKNYQYCYAYISTLYQQQYFSLCSFFCSFVKKYVSTVNCCTVCIFLQISHCILFLNYKIRISFHDAIFYSHSYIYSRVQKLTNLYKFKIEKCIHIFPFHLFKFFSDVSAYRLLIGHTAGNTVIEHIQFLTVLFITYSIFI